MTREEFEARYPVVLAWIQQTLAAHRPSACPISSLGFERLPKFFSADLLASAKVVYVDEVPKPPLRSLGLGEFGDFEDWDLDGITYLDTVFVRGRLREDEVIHWHELVHILQWRLLGPKGFLWAYADGLGRIGYRQSPLEVMAYTLENVFRSSEAPFDVVTIVHEQLTVLFGPLPDDGGRLAHRATEEGGGQMKLEDLVPAGSSAISVMTDGRYLMLSQPTAATGIWVVDGAREPDWVVVYYRHQGRNRVIVGEYLDTVPSHEEGRHFLLFWNWRDAGETDLNWPEFSGGGPNPVRYIDG